LQWALVTGACSGIGLELARELARRGYALVLVSNRAAELELAAQRLAADHGVTAHAVAMDLARHDAAESLYDKVRGLDVDIDVLVNNAGMLLFGEVVDTDPERIQAMLQLHVTTPSMLVRYFGADMRARRSGHIMFVSSASTWCDFPGVALYGGTKRYLRSFAASIREDLAPWGVNVTCLAPGAVATDLYGQSGGAAAKAAKLGLLGDPAAVAGTGLKGMFRGKALVLPGMGAKLMAVGAALTPRWLVHLVRVRTGFLSRPAAESRRSVKI
jgi:short-subunit dehydrogenase